MVAFVPLPLCQRSIAMSTSPNTPELSHLTAQLDALADAERATSSAWFFKTGPGDYGEGDHFRGIRVPELRKLVKEYRLLPHADVLALLHSAWHEDRLLAVLIW